MRVWVGDPGSHSVVSALGLEPSNEAAEAALAAPGCAGCPTPHRSPVEPPALQWHPDTVDAVLADLIRLGTALGREEPARALVTTLRRRIAGVHLGVLTRRHPRVAVLTGTSTPYLPGRWVPQLIELAGGIPVSTPPGPADWADLGAAEVVVLSPCGAGYDAARDQAEALSRARVLPGARIVPIEPDWVTVAGPGLVDGVEELATLLHSAQPHSPDNPVSSGRSPIG